ncbi:MAG: hypothetical protein WC389_05485 [Lutibacter sp.]
MRNTILSLKQNYLLCIEIKNFQGMFIKFHFLELSAFSTELALDGLKIIANAFMQEYHSKDNFTIIYFSQI